MQDSKNVSVVNPRPLIEGRDDKDIDVTVPGVLKLLGARVKADIDEYCRVAYDDGHRTHLGASLIGNKCRRKLWYTFRWVKKEQFDGRMQRLFNRGHREEARFVEWLRGIGFTVYEADQNGQQFRAPFAEGHGGGSLDAIFYLPPNYRIKQPFLGEFKTNGTGRGFSDLTAEGVAAKKEQHWVQMCMYGSHPDYQITHALYFNICKNDDDLHVEAVKLDWKLGEQMREKATQIIFMDSPPPKISEQSTYFECQSMCAYKNVCHHGAPVEINCRSCMKAKPVENKQWFCSHHNGIIPADFIPKGCGAHVSCNLDK
jgi:hypothetical protein